MAPPTIRPRPPGRSPLEGGASYAIGDRLYRLAWQVFWLVLAAWTPRQASAWRRLLLRAFGARIGARSDVAGSARVWQPRLLVMEDQALIAGGVDCYNMGGIVLRSGALVSQGAFLCGGTHDYDAPGFDLVTRPIEIGARAWICAQALVGPGVVVGEGAVLGARGVAFRDLDPWTVYAGNPAAAVKARTRIASPR